MLLVSIIVICIAIVIFNAVRVPEPTPVILTLNGPVQGNIKYSRNGEEYWEFLGIPYGKPPVGELMFKPPVSAKPWEEVKQVTSYPPICAQYDPFMGARAMGQMDCLYLNVFVNVANGSNNYRSKPTLVYIHGGAFMSGGSILYQPEYFMDHDIVLVVLQYRLGPYGFLNLEDEKNETDIARGNMGLKDQNLALRWVQDNIAVFGGDPQQVTLFGESAGAVSTHLHMISPMSQGLFQKAVIQSGSALTPWTFSKKPRDLATSFAKRVGCKINENKDLLECYQKTKWEDIVIHQRNLLEPLKARDFFVPTIDGEFLKELPQNSFKSGNFLKIPVIFGVNAGEGSVRTGRFDAMPELIPELDSNWMDFLMNLMILEYPISKETAIKIRDKYFGNLSFTENVETFKKNLTSMISESGFFAPVHLSATIHAKDGGGPTYLYFFNYTSNIYPGPYSAFRALRPDDWLPAEIKTFWAIVVDWVSEHVFGGLGSHAYGVTHGEDAFQLWNILGNSKFVSSYDADFSKSFIKTIVDFANETKPLMFREVVWSPINDDISSGKDEYSVPYMLMDNQEKPKMIPAPFANRIKFWVDQKDLH